MALVTLLTIAVAQVSESSYGFIQRQPCQWITPQAIHFIGEVLAREQSGAPVDPYGYRAFRTRLRVGRPFLHARRGKVVEAEMVDLLPVGWKGCVSLAPDATTRQLRGSVCQPADGAGRESVQQFLERRAAGRAPTSLTVGVGAERQPQPLEFELIIRGPDQVRRIRTRGGEPHRLEGIAPGTYTVESKAKGYFLDEPIRIEVLKGGCFAAAARMKPFSQAQGTVATTEGFPISRIGVTFSWRNEHGEVEERSGISDNYGRYTVFSLPPVVHRVRLSRQKSMSRVNVTEYPDPVTIAPGQSLRLNFTLPSAFVYIRLFLEAPDGTPIHRSKVMVKEAGRETLLQPDDYGFLYLLLIQGERYHCEFHVDGFRPVPMVIEPNTTELIVRLST